MFVHELVHFRTLFALAGEVKNIIAEITHVLHQGKDGTPDIKGPLLHPHQAAQCNRQHVIDHGQNHDHRDGAVNHPGDFDTAEKLVKRHRPKRIEKMNRQAGEGQGQERHKGQHVLQPDVDGIAINITNRVGHHVLVQQHPILRHITYQVFDLLSFLIIDPMLPHARFQYISGFG